MHVQPPRPVAPPGFGEPAPFFTAETDLIPRYSLEVAAGRWIVLMVFGSLSNELCRRAHEEIISRRAIFNDADAAFYGVSVDPSDRLQRGLANAPFGIRYFWDFDQRVSRQLGLADEHQLSPAVFLIDRGFRVLMRAPIEQIDEVLDRLELELAGEPRVLEATYAPVLTIPRVFEPELCTRLIAWFGSHEWTESGFSAEVNGRTVQRIDPTLKRRQDVTIDDPGLVADIEAKLRARLLPAVERAFGWQATRIERFLICRYAAEDHGFFSSHRDNVTAGTAHRKFAVSVNLDAEAHEGGDLRFPEFGRRTYRPPTGGATVFSCALLHEATAVTRGVRYVFVPFLYDEAGARLRQANLAQIGEAEGSRRQRRAAKKSR